MDPILVNNMGRAARQSSHLPALTGLRFIAALLVFLFHASLTKIIGFNPYADAGVVSVFQSLFSVAGWIGVSFFFVLSGFVMTWSARPGDTVAGYYRRRLVKLYPNHLVTWTLAMLLFAAPQTPILAWLPNLLMVHAWVPHADVFLSVNGPSWSLCCELLFYLLFPLMVRPLWRIPEQRLWLWAGGLAGALWLVQYVISLTVSNTPMIPEYPISMTRWWWAYFFPPFRIFEFMLGMVMARILLAGRWPAIGVWPAVILAALGYLLAGMVPFQYSLNAVTIVPVACLITAVAAAGIKGGARWLASAPMVWLGEISFGFYMVHLLVLMWMKELCDGRLYDTPTATLLVLAAIGVSVVGGWALYALVERPLMKLLGRRAPRKALLVGSGA